MISRLRQNLSIIYVGLSNYLYYSYIKQFQKPGSLHPIGLPRLLLTENRHVSKRLQLTLGQTVDLLPTSQKLITIM
jgi:hypothetical protein